MRALSLVSAVAAVAAVAGLVVACGPLPGTLAPGFTTCGNNTCQPGQYCFDQSFGQCVNGCTSDANCETGHVCQDISDVTGEGTCSEGASEGEGEEGEGEGGGNALDDCLAACDAFQDCGMQGSDYNDCLNTCPDLSENQQRTVATCGDGSCSDQRNCLEIDCFNDDDCGVDEQCVGSSCL